MTWDSHFPALSLSFAFHKMEIIKPTSKDCWMIFDTVQREPLETLGSRQGGGFNHEKA